MIKWIVCFIEILYSCNCSAFSKDYNVVEISSYNLPLFKESTESYQGDLHCREENRKCCRRKRDEKYVVDLRKTPDRRLNLHEDEEIYRLALINKLNETF